MNTPLSPEELQRYLKQINLCEVGVTGQQKIGSASILIIGAGGLGCAAALYLAASGIGKLGLIDDDHVELSNLPRQILYVQADVGKFKCEVAKQKIFQINPHVLVESHTVRFSQENALTILPDYDLIIDATDNFNTRDLINEACLKSAKTFVYGSIHHFEGQVAVFNAPDSKGRRGPNYRTLFPIPPKPNALPTCAEGGVLGPLPGIIGSIQALEALKLILQMPDTLSGKLLVINALTWNMRLYHLDTVTEEEPYEISLEALAKIISHNGEVDFIDIREQPQDNPTHFKSVWIPFSRLVENQNQISRDKLTILYCQKGHMSAQAARILRDRFQLFQVYSLKNGVSALLEAVQ